MAAITQTINAITTTPDIADPTNFEADANTLLNVELPNLQTQLNTWAGQVNALVAGLNAIAAGSAMAISYTFSTTTTDSDPGAGTLRLNNATQNTATVVRADLLDAAGTDWSSALGTIGDSTSTVKGYLQISKLNDASKMLLFTVSALASPSGYKNITVECIAFTTASPFTNGDTVIMEFARTGDKGDTGATGAAGASAAPFVDSTPLLKGSADATKLVAFDVDGLTSGTTRTVTIPDKSGTMAMTSDISTAQVLHVRDEKSSGTNGGGSTAGSWQVRTLNTVVLNEISGASLSSNTVTLPAGTYEVYGRSPSAGGDQHKVKLRNTTDSTDTLIGSSMSSATTNTTDSVVIGKFTIAGTKDFQLQYYCAVSSAVIGLGLGLGASVVEVFGEVLIKKVG